MPDQLVPHRPAPPVPLPPGEDLDDGGPRLVDVLRARHPGLAVVPGTEGALADLLGSSALARALRTAHQPVLALPRRAGGVAPVRRVLCGAGLSPTGAGTLREAAALAAAFGAPLTVLHVMPRPAATLAVESGWAMDGGWRDDCQKRLLARFVPPDVSAACEVHEAIDHGGLRERLLAWSEHADLVVVGLHSRAAYARCLSPVLRLMREAPCAVLAVPPVAEAGRES